MKALSVKPMWAGLIEAGQKTIEVRSRNTHHRGPLLICTSQKPPHDASVPVGVTLCIVDLVDARPLQEADESSSGVGHMPGKWAWILANPRPVRRVPVKGRLGFYDVPDHLLMPLRRSA